MMGVLHVSNLEKFTGKADIYARFRPDYPEALIRDLIHENDLDGSSAVADIGSGTGILTGQLLDNGLNVTAVEPNADMRHVAETRLRRNPRFTSVTGTAEQTGLKSGTIDLITVAQAFHWFDPDKFGKECRRVLKNGKRVALIWNSRVAEDPLTRESETVCRRFCPEFDGFSGGTGDESLRLDSFFRNGYVVKTYDHPLKYNLKTFIGRYLSASYAPKPADRNYRLYIEALNRLFQKFSREGLIAFPNVAECFSGRI